MVEPWWFGIVVVSSGVDRVGVVVNGDENALKKIDVYHEGINTKFGGENNQLMFDGESWEHPGCS